MKNTFVKVLSFLMALTMIVGTLGTVVVFAADCTHENATAGEVVAPKCNEVGYTWYTCDDCGASFKDDYVPVTGEHATVEKFKPNTSAESTCTASGWFPGQWCTDCETWIVAPTENKDKPAKGHSFGAGTITTKKYCTDAVYLVFKCTGCGKASHDLAAGDTAGKYAPVPGDVSSYPARVELEPAGTCDWGEYVVKTTPVLECDSTVVERTCKVCAKVETHTTPVTHKWLVWDASTKVEGYVKGEYCGEYLYYKYCEFCGTKTEVKTNPDRNKHGKTPITSMDTNLRNDATFVAWCNANGKNYLSLANGQRIGSDASCAKAGVNVYHCAYCDTYYEETVAKKPHSFEYNQKTVTDATKCVEAVALVRSCKYAATCKYTPVQVSVLTPAVEHNFVKDTNASTLPTCDESGKTVFVCSNPDCDETSTTYAPATGHKWGAYYNSDADGDEKNTKSCVDGIYQARKCTVCGDVDVDNIITVLKPTDRHKWSTGSDYKVRPATCSDGEWANYYCKNGDCAVLGDEVEGARDDKKRDATNHVPFVATDKEFVQLEGKYVAPTCTTKGKITYYCKCGAELTSDVEAPGHKPEEGLVKEFDFNNDKKIDLKVDVSAVDPKCNVEGFLAGEACTVCGAITTPRVSLGKNPGEHTAEPTEKKVHPATCLAPGYRELRYDKCCDLITTELTGEKQLEECAEATLKVYDEFKAPTCTENGYHIYTVCTECNKVTYASLDDCTNNQGASKCTAESHRILQERIETGVVTEAELQIAATGHDFTKKEINKEPAVPATCEKDGNTEYYYCLNGCGQHTAYTVLRKHTPVFKDYKKQDATCFAPGIRAGKYCSICIDIKGSETYEAARIPQRTHQFTEIIPVNAKTWDEDTMKVTKAIDCTKPAYLLKKCTCTGPDCGYIVMHEETFVAAKESHNWSVVVYEHDVIVDEGHILTDTENEAGITFACWASGYTSRTCADCGQESEKVSKNDQIKHYYYVAGQKVEIDQSCDNISKYEGFSCVLCGREVDASKDAADYKVYSDTAYIGSVHTYKQDKVNAKYDDAEAKWIPTSCTEYGYVSEYCVVCKKDKVATITVNPYNPTLNPYDEDGDERADIVKAIVDKKDPTAGAAGYVKYVCKYCNETHNKVLPARGGLEFSVVPSATKVAAGGNLTFVVKVKANADVTFNNIKLKFNLGTLFEIDGNNTNNALNYTFEGANVQYDFGTDFVNIYTEHTPEGNPANVTIKAGETVDFITFAVVANEFKYATEKSAVLTATLEVAEKYNANTKKTESIKDKTSVSQGAENKVTVVATADVNGDGVVAGVSDIQALIAVYGTFEYSAVADINRDGVVNGNDITALRKFSVITARKAIDYIEMIGQDLEAAIASAKVPNMNKDGIVDVNDEILFADAIIARLSAMDYKDYKYSTVEECVAALTNSIINAK